MPVPCPACGEFKDASYTANRLTKLSQKMELLITRQDQYIKLLHKHMKQHDVLLTPEEYAVLCQDIERRKELQQRIEAARKEVQKWYHF